MPASVIEANSFVQLSRFADDFSAVWVGVGGEGRGVGCGMMGLGLGGGGRRR